MVHKVALHFVAFPVVCVCILYKILLFFAD